MSYYLRIVSTQSDPSTQVWKIDDRTAVCLGVSNPEGAPAHISAHSGDRERAIRSIMNTDSGDHERLLPLG